MPQFRIFSLLASVAFLAYPGFARAETLPQAVAQALQTHPTLAQALAAQEAAREDVRIERSNYFPVISANTAVGRVYGDNATSRGLSVTRGAGYSNMWEGAITVNQMLFDSLKTPRLVAAAKARTQASTEGLAEVQNTLALQTALAYLNVLRSRESVALLDKHRGTLAEYEARIAKMVTEGAADDAELQQARNLGLDLQTLRTEFAGQVAIAEAEYSRLTGSKPDLALTMPSALTGVIPDTTAAALEAARAAHPQLHRAAYEVVAAEKSRAAQQSMLYPTIGAELSAYAKDVDDLIGGEVEDNRALLRANWALSTGGAEFAKIDKATAEWKQAKARQDDVARTLQAAIETAYADQATAQKLQTLAKEKLQADEALLKAYNNQFEGGKVRILQLLQTENQLLSTRLELLNAQYKSLAAQYSALGSMGSLVTYVSQGVSMAASTAHE